MKSILYILIGAIIISPVFLLFYPHVSDWHVFYDAAINGGTSKFHNPIWTLLLLKPFSIVESELAYSFFMGLTVSTTLVISHQVSRSFVPGLMAIISVPFFRLAIHGQIELFVLWGVFSSSVILSPALLLIKPQSAILSLGGRLKSPKSIKLLLASFGFLIIALFSVDIENVNLINQNISIFPYGLIIGAPVFVYGVIKDDVLVCAGATPLCMPYVITHSLFVPTFCLYARNRRKSFFLWVFLWVFFIINST